MNENHTYNSFFGKAYRYISFEGLFKTIANKSLRFTRSDLFNDPLDCSPLIAPSNWEKFYNEGGKNFIDFAHHYTFKETFKSIYICCFSKHYKEKNSYLMWSHYGQSHSQVCFEIDFGKTLYLGGPEIVSYPKDLVQKRKEYEKKINKNNNESGAYLVTTKSDIWKYEEEVRLIVDVLNSYFDFSMFKQNKNDITHLYANLDLRFISKVIFGINATLYNENKTIKLFESEGVTPKFEKMFIDPTTLELSSKTYK